MSRVQAFRDQINPRIRASVMAATLILCALFCVASTPAFAQQTLGSMTNNTFWALLPIQTFLSFLSYALGVFFSITAFLQMRAYVDDPSRNSLTGPLLRILAATFFIFAPFGATLLVQSISGNDVGAGGLVNFTNSVTPNTGNTGLEGALNRFVLDFAAPFLENLLPFFAYIAGLIFMLIGLKRLALGNGNGPQAPGGMGTMASFFIAAALMAFGYIMFTVQGSLFGATTMVSNPLVDSNSGNALMTERVNQTMWGIFMFLRVVGYISVLRAMFMLRAAGEGQNVSMMAVTTHLVAGALLANGTAFVLAAQNTFVDPANHILR